MIAVARAEALFASDIATGSRPDLQEASSAITTTVHRYGGVRGCAVQMAGAFADLPETAVVRMRWARGVVQHLFGPAPRPRIGAAWPSVPAQRPGPTEVLGSRG
jgi:hypothetical protein